MNLKDKRKIIFLLGATLVLTVIGAISYAFFSPLGESNPEQATISTGTARATFRDNDTGITGKLSLGESITKKFTIENTGTVETTVKMYWKDLINTYTVGSLTYTLTQAESEEGIYTEIVSKTNVPKSKRLASKILSNDITIPAGETRYYNLVITLNYLADVNQDEDKTAKFSSSFSLEDQYGTKVITAADILAKFGEISKGVRTAFDTVATTDEGIYEMQDDYGTSYYYRGAVENNYMKYGVNKSGQEMWWRSIRINGDGSVRIVYDGTQGYANGVSDSERFIKTLQSFNATSNDAKFFGWMYGPANEVDGTVIPSTSKEEAQSNIADSDIKKIVDTWYKENIEDTGYGINVSDTIFCNDRSTPGKEITRHPSDTGLGYGKNITVYGMYVRMKIGVGQSVNASPSFRCPEQNDSFTVGDTIKGNGALTYPVGLITADEIVAAGSGKYNISGGNSKYYLYKSNSYYQWSLSPQIFGGQNALLSIVNVSGELFYSSVNSTSGAVAPVINLTPEYTNSMIGTGTIDNPYREA